VSPAVKPAAAPARKKTPAAAKAVPKNAASAPLQLVPKRAPALPPPVEIGTLPVAPRAAQP
jgi:hypothetical protein